MKKILVLEDKEVFYRFIKDFDSDEFEFVFIDNIHLKKLNHSLYFKDLAIYDAICSIHYNDVWFNLILFEAREQNVKTIFLMDGPLEWQNTYSNYKLGDLVLCRPVIHDYILAISKEQAKTLKEWNKSKKVFTYRNYRIVKDIKGNTIENKYDFLITTANTAYFDKNEYNRLLIIIKEIILVLKEKKYRVKFRIFDKQLKNDLSDFGGYENNTVETIEFALINSKCVITTPSSIAIESMYYNKATALLIYRDSPLFYQTGWSISMSVNISESLENMLAYDVNKMEFQNEYIKKMLSKIDIQHRLELILKQKKQKNNLTIEELKFQNKIYKKVLDSRFNLNFTYMYIKIRKIRIITNIIKIIKGFIK